MIKTGAGVGGAVGAVVGGRGHSDEDVRGERSTFLFKFIMVGDSGVGKSCLLRAYKGGSFLSNMDSTIGVDFFSMKVRVGSGADNNSNEGSKKSSSDVEEGCGGIVVKVQIWDTAGHERFKSITQSYYRNAAGCFLVYDLMKPETKHHLGVWQAEVASISPDVVFIQVGTKCDLLVDSTSVGEGMHYCSARTGEGVSEAFGALISRVHKERASPALHEYRTVPGGGVKASKSGAVPLCSGVVYYPPSFYETATAHLRAGAAAAAAASEKDDVMGGNMCPGCAIL